MVINLVWKHAKLVSPLHCENTPYWVKWCWAIINYIWTVLNQGVLSQNGTVHCGGVIQMLAACRADPAGEYWGGVGRCWGKLKPITLSVVSTCILLVTYGELLTVVPFAYMTVHKYDKELKQIVFFIFSVLTKCFRNYNTATHTNSDGQRVNALHSSLSSCEHSLYCLCLFVCTFVIEWLHVYLPVCAYV